MSDDLLSLWTNPPALYRGAPFWSWNAKLDPDRLRRQIRSLRGGGMGGFFMHSRYGLKTPYLSDRWFACVDACVAEARTLNMKAYLYDEDRWPSGSAGGKITREHPAFRQHMLLAIEADQVADDETVVAHFAVRLDDQGRLLEAQPIDDPSGAPAGAKAVAFVVRTAPTSGWYNDGAYMDTMNADAVAEFIECTHQAYAERYGEDFGGLVPAIFTDEPNYGFQFHETQQRLQGWVQWTPALPEEFRRRRGYDLRGHLPELIWPGADEAFSKVRLDFRRTLTELFVESFSAQIGHWCRRHHIALTGHVLLENTPATQTSAVGAAMPHYEHMQWPGIDILCDQADELSTAKQCTSVADQLGRERVLTELYGCTGWDWPLEGHKFVGDWQYACGVNFRCPHLSHYSLAGGAKRDYPASILDHSPWWPYYHVVEDYFARLGVMLTRGVPVRDVLVIHPIESVWGLFTPAAGGFHAAPSDAVREIQDPLETIIRTLSGEHYDWDYADESLLDRHAALDDGDGDTRIRVGRMRYKLVIVPPTRTLRASTVYLLKRLAEAGGLVLMVGRAPERVNGKADAEAGELADLAARADLADGAWLATLEQMLPRRVSVTQDGRELTCVWTMLREADGGQILFLQSHDRTNGHSMRVSLPAAGPAVRWDLQTGERTLLPADVQDGAVSLELALPPTGSALVTLGLDAAGAAPAPAEPQVTATQTLDGPFVIERTEPNTLPLDYCRWRFLGEDPGADVPWSESVPTLAADKAIRAKFGLGPRIGREHQPWYLYATGAADTSPRGWCELRYTFHVTDVPAACRLAMESPEDFEIRVNGQALAPRDEGGHDTGEPDAAGSDGGGQDNGGQEAAAPGGAGGYWVDEDIRTVDVAGLLQAGENEVLLRFNYRVDMELEDLYLVGEFGTRRLGEAAPAPGTMTLVAPPRELATGSWVGQDLDFYTGAVRYRMQVDAPPAGGRVRLRVPDVACTAAAVHVGGQTFVLPWAPFQADITDALTPGTNDVLVEIIGGRKNTLGPLHTPWERGTGPGNFSPDHPKWRDEYYLTDHGLTGPVVLETLA